MPSEQLEQVEASAVTLTFFLGTVAPILLGVLCIYLTAKFFTRGNKRHDIKEVHVDKDTKSRERESQSKTFTAQEVAQHCSREDCWIILDNQVYDVTSYVEEHPGGDSILNNAGRESSEGFHGPQHPSRVDDHVKDFYIGELHPRP